MGGTDSDTGIGPGHRSIGPGGTPVGRCDVSPGKVIGFKGDQTRSWLSWLPLLMGTRLATAGLGIGNKWRGWTWIWFGPVLFQRGSRQPWRMARMARMLRVRRMWS